MMGKKRISGIICEFNPLHNGHAALLKHAHEAADAVVCVMSGNFVERGDIAVLDKWTRTRLALQNGADLVVELPLPWAMAGAERFARGGVALLSATGADTLCFGSECGEIEPLARIAAYLLSPAFEADVRPFLDRGEGFAAARGAAISAALGDDLAKINEAPNNILGIEYIKAIRSLGAQITPQTMRRLSVEHDSPHTEGSFASASRIRELSAKREDCRSFVPETTAQAIEQLRRDGQFPASLKYLERGILAFLSGMTAEALRRVPDVSEGLENRILAAAKAADTLDALYDAAKTKRYSHARLRRVVLSAYLGLTEPLPALPPYLHVLGMNDVGTAVLREADCLLPFVLRAADVSKCDETAQRIFELEAHADDVYTLCTERRRPAGINYTMPLIKT